MLRFALLAFVACALLPGAAQAAFPGANGKIVFDSTRDDATDPFEDIANREIYSMNPDGTGARRLTRTAVEGGGANNHDPAWSPDGRRIVFVKAGGIFGSTPGDI